MPICDLLESDLFTEQMASPTWVSGFKIGDRIRISKNVPYCARSANGYICDEDMWNHRGQTATIAGFSTSGKAAILKDPETPFEGVCELWDLALLEHYVKS